MSDIWHRRLRVPVEHVTDAVTDVRSTRIILPTSSIDTSRARRSG